MSGGHGHAGGAHRWRLRLAFILVAGYFVVELVAGLMSGSLALLSDAGHMAADVVALGAALVATRIATRPDNTGRPTTRADITVVAVGGSLAGAYPSRAGTTDVTVWAAQQGGHWYEQSHRGRAVTASLGQRFDRVAWRPWLRAGVAWASGDGDAADDRHATFFPMLPSGDRVSSLNAYALMNLRDLWTRAELSPHRAFDLAAGVHRVQLADGADRWYQGSGATIRAGNYFGYQGRNARGATSLGTVLDAQITWRPTRWWTLRALGGRVLGGDVQATLFAGTRLTTGWVESTLRF